MMPHAVRIGSRDEDKGSCGVHKTNLHATISAAVIAFAIPPLTLASGFGDSLTPGESVVYGTCTAIAGPRRRQSYQKSVIKNPER
jgi:hypothetical protein